MKIPSIRPIIDGRKLRTPLEERFWPKVDKTGDCWLWTGWRNDEGYGYIRDVGRIVRAHRASYELTQGAIPEGMMVLHKCDNPPCVRPDHLRLGTNGDNMIDMYSKGRR